MLRSLVFTALLDQSEAFRAMPHREGEAVTTAAVGHVQAHRCAKSDCRHHVSDLVAEYLAAHPVTTS